MILHIKSFPKKKISITLLKFTTKFYLYFPLILLFNNKKEAIEDIKRERERGSDNE